MRIALISRGYPTPSLPAVTGGAEVAQKMFATVLADAGHEVHVIRAGPRDRPVAPETDGSLQVRTLPTPDAIGAEDLPRTGAVGRVLWHLRDDYRTPVVAPLAALLKEVGAQVALSGNIGGLSASVWRAARRAGAAPVHYLHDHYLLCHRSTRYRRGRICVRSCMACLAFTRRRRAATADLAAVVGNSQFLLDAHIDAGLFNGIPKAVIEPYASDALAPPPAPSTRPVTFGYIGRISAEKGVDRLAEAFGLSRTATPLVIGGAADAAAQARLRQAAAGKPVEFLGFVSPAEFFAKVDVLVAPSLLNEPYGRVVLEANSFGRPAAVARRGGLVEALGRPDFGWTFEPDDRPAFAALLDHISADPAAIAARAPLVQRYARTHTAARLADRFVAIFEQARAGAAEARYHGDL